MIEGLRHEPVAHTGFREKVAWSSRVGFEFLAQLCHIDAQVMRMLYVRGTPNIAQELPVSQHLAGIACKL